MCYAFGMGVIYPIQPKELTQGFGENPAAYARFGLKGHNGWDFKTKFSDTPLGKRYIFASHLSKFYTKGNQGNDGFGLYFDVLVQLKSLWKLTYAHCASIETFTEKKPGEQMAISDNTGNSTGAHLHLTTKKGKLVNGVFQADNNDNGYFGAVDPQLFFTELDQFTNSQPTAPMDTKKAVQFDRILIFLKQEGITPTDASEQYVDADKLVNVIKQIVADLKSNKTRAGRFDQVCNWLFGSIDSNGVTPDQIKGEVQKRIAAAQAPTIDESAVRADERQKTKAEILQKFTDWIKNMVS